MKLLYARAVRHEKASLPVRGAWVEMPFRRLVRPPRGGRSPCGERGLKCPCGITIPLFSGRSPCGERGLKFQMSTDMAGLAAGRSPCGERGLK